MIGEDIAAQILPVLGKALHTQLGTQIVQVLYTTNLNAFYADMLPTVLAQGLDRLDGVVASGQGRDQLHALLHQSGELHVREVGPPD